MEPKQCPGFTFRKSILIGRTDLDPEKVRAFMEKLAEEYSGNTYHLITKNCNHFCNDVCVQLTRRSIPSWVNRLARFGKKLTEKKNRTLVYSVLILCFSKKVITFYVLCFWFLVLGLFCNCVLPAELNETKVRQVRSKEEKVPEAEEKKLRSRSSRFPPGPSLSSSGSLNRSRSRRGGERRRQCLPPSPPVTA